MANDLASRAPRQIPAARLVFSDSDRAAVLEMIDESLRGGSLTLGPHTQSFEGEFRSRHGQAFAIAVSSGTSALEIILRTVGVERSEVVVPTNTFFATAAAVLHAGGVPRFADVDRETLALSPATVEAALTESTAAVVLVHIGGLITPEVEEIRALCERRGLVLIEDAAHAHGSTFAGRTAGSFGHAAAFSFYPTKVMTSAEGGMILTNERRVCDEATIYRDQGKDGFLGGDHVRLGYAWRMSELHAAVGIVQLRRLDEFIAARRRVAAAYDQGLADLPGIRLIVEPAECRSNYYKYVALLAPGIDRPALKQRLRQEFGVTLSGEVYALPLHRQPVWADTTFGEFPVADNVCDRQICLPIHSDMTEDEAAYVLRSVRTVVSDAQRTVQGVRR